MLSAVGSYLIQALQGLGGFLADLGLGADEAATAKVLVKLISQKHAFERQLEAEQQELKQLEANDPATVLAQVKERKVNITTFLHNVTDAIGNAKKRVAAAEKELDKAKTETLAKAQQVVFELQEKLVSQEAEAEKIRSEKVVPAGVEVEKFRQLAEESRGELNRLEQKLKEDRRPVELEAEIAAYSAKAKDAEAEVTAEFRIALDQLGDQKEWEHKKSVARECGALQEGDGRAGPGPVGDGCRVGAGGRSDGAGEKENEPPPDKKCSTVVDSQHGAPATDVPATTDAAFGVSDDLLSFFQNDEPALRDLDLDLEFAELELKNAEQQSGYLAEFLVNQTGVLKDARLVSTGVNETFRSSDSEVVEAEAEIATAETIAEEKKDLFNETSREHTAARRRFEEVGKDVLTLQKEFEEAVENRATAKTQLETANATLAHSHTHRHDTLRQSKDCNDTLVRTKEDLVNTTAAIAVAKSEQHKIIASSFIEDKKTTRDASIAEYDKRKKIEEDHRTWMNSEREAQDKLLRKLYLIDEHHDMPRKLAEKQESREAQFVAERLVQDAQKVGKYFVRGFRGEDLVL